MLLQALVAEKLFADRNTGHRAAWGRLCPSLLARRPGESISGARDRRALEIAKFENAWIIARWKRRRPCSMLEIFSRGDLFAVERVIDVDLSGPAGNAAGVSNRASSRPLHCARL